MARFRRTGWLVGLGLALWWARLMAHSKTPPPEGHWRELTPEELDR